MRSLTSYLLIPLFLLTSCTSPNPNWKTIELDNYLLDVPQNFTFKPIRGIDSQGGELTNDTIKFYTDFGYYTDTLYETPKEYINKHWFLSEAEAQFMKSGVTYDARNMPKVDVVAVRPSTVKDSDKTSFLSGSDYIATCSHDGKLFDWPVRLPAEVKQHVVTIDTSNNAYRRMVVPKKGYTGTTGVYMRCKGDLNPSMNAYYAIVIAARSLSVPQKQLALKIFKTLRRKPKKD